MLLQVYKSSMNKFQPSNRVRRRLALMTVLPLVGFPLSLSMTSIQSGK